MSLIRVVLLLYRTEWFMDYGSWLCFVKQQQRTMCGC